MIVFLLRLSVSWMSRNHSCIGCVFRMSATRSSACCVENPFVYQLHAENARFQSRFVLSRGSFEVAAFQKRFYSIHPCAVFCEYFLWDIWNYLDTSLISLAVWGGTTSDNMSTIWRGGVNHDNSVPGQISEGQLSSVELRLNWCVAWPWTSTIVPLLPMPFRQFDAQAEMLSSTA